MGRFEKLFVNSRLRATGAARRAENALRRLEVRPGLRYLDVGCGTGAAAIHLARRYGIQTFGPDVDPEQVRIAARNSLPERKAQFLAGGASRLPFVSNSLDIVACSMVGHHIASWEAAIAEMVRVVRPSGFVIYRDFAVPSRMATLLTRVSGRSRIPREESLRSVAERIGLHPISASTRLLHFETVWQKP